MIATSNGITWDRGAAVRMLARGGKALVVASLLLLYAFDEWAGAAAVGVISGTFAVAMSYALGLTQTSAPGTLEVKDGLLVVQRGGVLKSVAAKDVTSAWIARRVVDGRLWANVEIRTRRGTTFTARIPEESDARALVDALGFGASGKAVRIDLGRASRRLLHPPIGFLAYIIGALVGMIPAMLLIELLGAHEHSGIATSFGLTLGIAFTYLFLKRLFAAPVVTVGHDGVTVEKNLRKRHVRRADLKRVHVPGPGLPLVIERRDGKDLGVSAVLLDPGRVGAVVELAEERLPDLPPPDRAAAFERGGRDVAAWRAQIRTALDPGYRATGASVEDAAAVLTSASSSVEQRLGAALALRVAGEPKERVRVAAEGAADPRVRVALEAIADDAEDAVLEEKLQRLAL